MEIFGLVKLKFISKCKMKKVIIQSQIKYGNSKNMFKKIEFRI